MYRQESVEDIRSYDLLIGSALRQNTLGSLGPGVNMRSWNPGRLVMVHDPETNSITYRETEVEKIEEP